jgi:cytochrome c
MKLIIVAIVNVFLFQENNPPLVKITAPKLAAVNAAISYSISVSDKEDGDTKYDEINPNEILLLVQYGENAKSIKGVNDLHAMMASNCMNCHAFKSKLIGPSYMDISKKYSSANMPVLVKHVKEGSKGVWGDIVMPTHPELSDEEINRMMTWILNYKNEKNTEYHLGKEGLISVKNAGPVILTASYLDHEKAMGSDKVLIQVK